MLVNQKGQSVKSFGRPEPPRPLLSSSFVPFCPANPSLTDQDEIDALGSSRSDDVAHSGVLTTLLNEMDGIEKMSGVTVVAATNRPDVLVCLTKRSRYSAYSLRTLHCCDQVDSIAFCTSAHRIWPRGQRSSVFV